MPATGFDSTRLEQFYRDSRRLDIPVAEAYARAEGYVWGWQDARSELNGTAQATAFADAYARYFAEFLTQKRCFVHSGCGSWRAWRKYGDLTAARGRKAR
ncbi:hypothetical protein [Nocardia brasiliensis]|uniref:hypothetical protein n=1 Tax=Nocardia brasiliensis TaxID=37326 RepID=UPI00366AC1BC